MSKALIKKLLEEKSSKKFLGITVDEDDINDFIDDVIDTLDEEGLLNIDEEEEEEDEEIEWSPDPTWP